MDSNNIFYSTDELADMLKVSKRTLFRYIHSGELHAIKIGKVWRIPHDSLESFLQSKRKT